MGRVEGKVAIVTGAGSGIGQASMRLLAAEGANVMGAGRTMSALEQTLATTRSSSGDAAIFACDLSEEDAGQRLAQVTLDKFGRIDILVHAAGVGWSWGETKAGTMEDVLNTGVREWNEVININLSACFLMCRAILPQMIAQGSGSIVNVASMGGFTGMTTAHTYTAAKAGMINLTRSMGITYAKRGIRVNAIAPGYVDTPMIASVVHAFEDPAMAEQLSPMARAGTPIEMAYGCLYLASDEASYCNGSVLVIDGGTTARQ
jgi:NAD(P)-dependent dehydrogenase (short-subunit alcohol dehydrogenase family)